MIKQSGNKLGIVVMAVLGVFLLSPALANSQESCPAATQQEVKTQGEISAQGDNEAKRAPVFCPAKSTGQLCGHGTAARLKLDGQNRERWNAVVRRYNEQVENAQKQLIEEARPFLTPEQAKQVESYFAPPKSSAASIQTSSADKSLSVTIKPTSFATAGSGAVSTETPAARSATIKVTGMTCGGCAKSIELALSKVEGVREAKVNYERGIAEVTYDDSKVTLDQIHAAIRKTGFGVSDEKR